MRLYYTHIHAVVDIDFGVFMCEEAKVIIIHLAQRWFDMLHKYHVTITFGALKRYLYVYVILLCV